MRPDKRHLELILLFVGIPVFLAMPVYLIPKLIVGALGLFYIVIIALKSKAPKRHKNKEIDWASFLRTLAIRFLIIAIFTFLLVYIWSPETLFKVPRSKPLLWLGILLLYSVLSVYPQELLYRPFFFDRYGDVFECQRMLIFINAILFSIAHLFFANMFVLILTFVGGLIFAYTYSKTRSILLVTIEHAVYGCWLFTVGLGDMLGFPS